MPLAVILSIRWYVLIDWKGAERVKVIVRSSDFCREHWGNGLLTDLGCN